MGIRGVRSRLSLKLHNEIKTKQNGLTWWSPSGSSKDGAVRSLTSNLGQLEAAFWVLERDGCFALTPGSLSEAGGQPFDDPRTRCLGFLPPLPIKHLGDPGFRADHRLRYAYVAGAMANGIASVELVEAVGRAGMLGFFGAAGLDLTRIEAAIERLQRSLAAESFGFNLIHSPNEPDREAATVSLYLRKGIRLVEAAAYLRLTLPVVRYRVAGIFRDAAGRAAAPNRIVAKVSRVEVAAQFLSPPPEEMLNELVRSREITPEQAQLAADIPVAQDVTAEADSAGHTDNRPLVTLLPTLLSLRNRLQQSTASRCRYGSGQRVGCPLRRAGGGFCHGRRLCGDRLGEPSLCGIRRLGKRPDVCWRRRSRPIPHGAGGRHVRDGREGSGPEAGHDVSDARREAVRALPRLLRLEMLPANERATLEKQFFRTSLEAAWQSTRDYFVKRDT